MSSTVKSERSNGDSSRRDHNDSESRKRKEPDDRDRERDRRDRGDRTRDDRRDRDSHRDRGADRGNHDRDRRDRDSERHKREEELAEDDRRKRARESDIKEEEIKEEESTNSRKAPLDVEEALKKKKEDEIQKVKPTFLSKEERQKLALAKRAAEIEERQRKIDEDRKTREKFMEDAKRDTISNDPREKERREREKRDKERRERDRKREENKERERKGLDKEKEKPKQEGASMDAKELELMKSHYLGTKKDKKRVIKPSEKFKFVFDWDEGEDTTKELNPLYADNIEMRPQFGRGFMGGIDKKEQIEDYQKFLSEQDKLLDRKKGDQQVHQIGKEREEVDKKLKDLTKSERPAIHWSDKSLDQMTDRDWRIFKEDYNISTKGGSIPHPIRSWKEASFNSKIVDAIDRCGYKEPTPIQRQAIPIALGGRDVMGIAETGSGKTAAYLIPMLAYILKLPPMTPENEGEGPYAIVLAPTRELATQIDKDISHFAEPCGVRCMCVVGGASVEEQAMTVRRGIEIIVATPGRLNDLIESRYLVLNQCTYVVLDEADRMIDMGFEPQVNSILDAMPVTNLKSENEVEAATQEASATKGKYRTTIMYSATMPVGVERLSRKFLRRPAYVIIGEVGRAVDRITQRIEWIKDENIKLKRLLELLQDGVPPIIIFVNKKKIVDMIAKQVDKCGFKSITLHSSRSQTQREAAIEGFKAFKFDVLIATDVAGRGLDVKGVTHVINFDMPKTVDDYIHRIGRTGRAGMDGLATSFITPDDTHIMFDLKNMLTATGQFVPPELNSAPAAQFRPGAVPEKTARKDTIIYAKS